MKTHESIKSFGVRYARLGPAALVSILGAACTIEVDRGYDPPIVESSGEPPAVTILEPAIEAEPVVYETSAPLEPATAVEVRYTETESPSVSLTVFETSLAPYGEWAFVADYGRVWRPTCVPVTFRPYTCGHWVYTDCGWTFVSDDPWGVVVYHYGRWTVVPGWGWVWVPDTVWAPAWVSWRTCDSYIGWAPLPPGPVISRSFGFSRFDERNHPEHWCFVPSRHFLARNAASVVVDGRQNVTIINETTNITNVTIVNNVAKNRGPDYRQIEQVTNSRVDAKPAVAIRNEGERRFLGQAVAKAPGSSVQSVGFLGKGPGEAKTDRNNGGWAARKAAAPPARAEKQTPSTGRTGFAQFGKGVVAPERIESTPKSPVQERVQPVNRGSARPESGGFRTERQQSSQPWRAEKSAPDRNRTAPLYQKAVPTQPQPAASPATGGAGYRGLKSEKSVTPSPRVEGRIFGPGSAATPRSETPAAAGVIIRTLSSNPQPKPLTGPMQGGQTQETTKSKPKNKKS